MSDTVRSEQFLVTGGGGFVGRHAVSELVARGHSVTALGRGPRPCDLPSQAAWRAVDLLAGGPELKNIMSDVEPTVLLHLAWETRHGVFWTSPTNLDWLSASVRLLRAYCEAGGRRVVVAGTCVEYASPDVGPCHERETEIRPAWTYAVSKDVFRRLLHGLSETEGLDYAWGRVFFPFGVGEGSRRLVPSVVDALLEGREAACSSGRQVRDFMDVRDCGAALAALAASDVRGPVNIASGVPITIAALVRKIGALLDQPSLIKLGALADRPGEPLNLWADVSILHNEVGFTPRHSLDEALIQAIDWWRIRR